MPDDPKLDQNSHEKARDLAEKALDEYAKGDQAKGDKLAEQAVQIDRSAVEEVVQDLDEDAGSDHTPSDS